MSSHDWKPPTKNGVGASSIVLPPGPWHTILEFLTHRFATVTHQEWVARMARGDVLAAQGTAITVDTPYQPHSKVHYYRHLRAEPRIPFTESILYHDEHLVVADKPHFLPVMPAGRYVQETLLVRLKQSLGIDTLVPIHRIDRDTAGLVLFSIQPTTRDHYVALFRQRAVVKSYEAIAAWRPELHFPLRYRSLLVPGDAFMQMREMDGMPNSETEIDVLEVSDTRARYRLSPVTGKKHQLRAHMAALGIAIINDRIYPQLKPQNASTEADYRHPLQLLAQTLSFIDPISGQQRQFASKQKLSWDNPAK
jgi:tRNA pseudouridine32 synthase/23S rRNA pseudouridine746 synthase